MDRIKKLKNQIIQAIALIILLIFIGFSSTGRTSIYQVEHFLGSLFQPAANMIGTAGSEVGSSIQSIIHMPSLSKENKKMKEELSTLREENRNLKDIIARSTILSNELAMKRVSNYIFVEAHVIMKSDLMHFNRFTIDKGKNDGIKLNDTVVIAQDTSTGLSTEGLVGKVVELGNNYANIRSIIDEGNAVSFKTIRSQEGGIVKGKNQRLDGYSYDLYGDIVQGDEVFTSGIGDLYERDIYIGVVSRVLNDEDEMIKSVRIQPAVNFNKLFKVYVITGVKDNE